MYPRGKHVLVVEDDPGQQQVDELIVRHSTRWPTIAQNGDEATAILRSTLHPLIVLVNASMCVDGGDYGSLLLSLLANSDFASTHAYIVQTDARRASVSASDALRDEVARQSVGFVAWLESPLGLGPAFVALHAAEDYLTSHG